MNRAKTIATSVILMISSQAMASIITSYDLQGHSSKDSAVRAIIESRFTEATDVTSHGVNLLRNYGEGIYTASGWGVGSERDASTYYEWSITADEGYAIRYDTIDLSLVRGNYGGAHGAESWMLAASIDGFDSSERSLLSWDISGSCYDDIQSFVGQDISALGTQAGTMTFRLYGYDAAGTSDFSGLVYAHPDLSGQGVNLTVHGAAVPEPATMSLLAIGALGLLKRRKR